MEESNVNGGVLSTNGNLSVHRDRLSELPRSIIYQIFSFLPMRDVVSTTFLSKHWKDLWTSVPYLNFSEFKIEYACYMKWDVASRESVLKFVNGAIMSWRGVKVLKFKFDIGSIHDESFDSYIYTLTRFAVNNEVEDLEIIAGGGRVPQFLFTCSSLRKLSLRGLRFQMTGCPRWNRLKILKIHVFEQSLGIINAEKVMVGSPELVEFDLRLYDIDSSTEALVIKSTSLKKLKVHNYISGPGFGKDDRLVICCPNLETLEISGLFGECLFIDISSLIDATLHFFNYAYLHYDDEDEESENLIKDLGKILMHFFSAIQRVERIALSDLSVQMFRSSLKNYVHSPLPNVKFLFIKLEVLALDLDELIKVLSIFPDLKMLVIDGQGFQSQHIFDCGDYEPNFSMSCLQEPTVVEIDLLVVKVVEFLFQRAIKLEKLVLRSLKFVSEDRERDMAFQICTDNLLVFPDSSPAANVMIFKNNCST